MRADPEGRRAGVSKAAVEKVPRFFWLDTLLPLLQRAPHCPAAIHRAPSSYHTHTRARAPSLIALLLVSRMAEESAPLGGKVDLQSLSIRAYLDQTVVPVLLQGMSQLVKERCVVHSTTAPRGPRPGGQRGASSAVPRT